MKSVLLPCWLLTVTVCCITAAAEGAVCANWIDHSLQIEERSGHGLAYDSERQVVVLFGGFSDKSLGDTWEYDGTAWHEIQPPDPKPQPRDQHAMAYDPVRHVTVLFGGRDGQTSFEDTWEWNGNTWTPREVAGPSPRYGLAMIYHPPAASLLLFGGSTYDGLSGETWLWNGQAWTEKLVAGPSPRMEHAIAYDPAHNQTILFGGTTENGSSGETWVWDGTSWTLRTSEGPSPRYGHAMSYQIVNPVFGPSFTLLFGGTDGVSTNETWGWDGEAWSLRSTKGPTGRRDHAMVSNIAQQSTFLFGGHDGANRGDFWEWDAGWQPVSTSPSARFDHAMVYNTMRATTLLFGGFDGRKERDLWEWNGNFWLPLFEIDHSPPAMVRHAMAYDSERNVATLFGGYSDEGFHGETWEWNGTAWNRAAVHDPSDPSSSPSPRINHSMVYDVSRHVTLLFGGSRVGPGGAAYNNELWAWNGNTRQWTMLTNNIGPRERENLGLAFDSDRGVAVLYGGGKDTWSSDPLERLSGETWEWDGLTWQLKAETGPGPRALHSLAYDPIRRRTLLFGGWGLVQEGQTLGEVNDLWAWDGMSWNELGPSGPALRYAHGASYDAARGVFVVFGGMDAAETWHNDLWEWADPFLPMDFNCDGRIDNQDLTHWFACATRASIPQTNPGCLDADLDHDLDVDVDDFGILQRCYGGPIAPADPSCVN